MDENATILEPTNPFDDAGLVRLVGENGDSEQWVTPDGRWGIQPRYWPDPDGWMLHLGWDVFGTGSENGEYYVEAIYAKQCDTPAEAVEALRWVIAQADGDGGG